MESFLLVLELIGTMAFSAAGAMTGLRKNMDIFGVCILGLTTAVGGGVIRDLILGHTPPATFQNPIYATVAVATALILFLPQVRHFLMRDQLHFDLVLFWMRRALVSSRLWGFGRPLPRCPGRDCSCWYSWG